MIGPVEEKSTQGGEERSVIGEERSRVREEETEGVEAAV
jgi:hypothetical protein